jgi:hypothetical protein
MLPFFAKLPRCLVGIEACNNSHFWARKLAGWTYDRTAQCWRRAERSPTDTN